MEKRDRLSCENTTGAARARMLQRVAVVLTTVSIQYYAGWMGVKVCLNMLAAKSGLVATTISCTLFLSLLSAWYDLAARGCGKRACALLS